jgi:cytochrome c551/c552
LRRSVFALLFFVSSAQAQQLISGPGSTLTQNKCSICHELQHIERARLSRGEWADNLRNMKERGTPMNEAEMAVILDYLDTYYNREKPAPPPSPDTLMVGGRDPVQKLLNSHGCAGCHALEDRTVGPSFKEIAARYANDAGAGERLAAKVRSGGAGVWGQVPMPPNTAVGDADLNAIVGWVLRQK